MSKVKRVCGYCGAEFEIYASKIKDGKGKFCCQKCYWLSMTGENNKNWKERIQVICKNCGKKFKTLDKNRVYCSEKCMGEYFSKNYIGEKSNSWKGGNVKCVCVNCGNEFEIPQNEIKNGRGKFCCQKCYGEYYSGENSPYWKGGKVTRICEVCGKEFKVVQSLIDRGGGKYCSNKCYGVYLSKHYTGENNPIWQGGKSFDPYCPKFNDKKKEEIREKYNRKCFICGKTEEENGMKLDVHHVDYNKNQGCDGNKWALIPLCRSCHSKTHYNRKLWEVLLKYKLWCEKQNDFKNNDQWRTSYSI